MGLYDLSRNSQTSFIAISLQPYRTLLPYKAFLYYRKQKVKQHTHYRNFAPDGIILIREQFHQLIIQVIAFNVNRDDLSILIKQKILRDSLDAI